MRFVAFFVVHLISKPVSDSFDYPFQAAKILANLIIMGSGIMVRAFAQAYKQALNTFVVSQSSLGYCLPLDASKSGVAQETLQNAVHKVTKTMTEAEARQILGVSEQTSWEEVLKRYDTLFERNAKSGSFYLQSKVHRAKEMLETVHKGPEPGTSG
ncbi:hypothetical protein C5167_022120 [Papaver somniferum]|uniref:Mitochondrial import inner membrane translocase subunit Tim16 n=1 Tax=Papaver somniferum TaxID=3469 RepID=A0A4Y7JK25_PAPSO|nr:hypothetical protein C5167_022120 [Papaver somniferum]